MAHIGFGLQAQTSVSKDTVLFPGSDVSFEVVYMAVRERGERRRGKGDEGAWPIKVKSMLCLGFC